MRLRPLFEKLAWWLEPLVDCFRAAVTSYEPPPYIIPKRRLAPLSPEAFDETRRNFHPTQFVSTDQLWSLYVLGSLRRQTTIHLTDIRISKYGRAEARALIAQTQEYLGQTWIHELHDVLQRADNEE